MRRIVGWSLTLLLLVFMAGLFFIPDDPVTDNPGVVGDYIINGLDPQGDEYAGILSVTTRPDGDLDFNWIVTGAFIEGVGVVDEDVIEVVWEASDSQADSVTSGSTRFVIGDDGTLRGVRLVDGVPGEGTEVAFPDD